MEGFNNGVTRQCAVMAYVVLISSCFAPVRAQSTGDRPAAIATPAGVFVYLGKDIPKQNHYEVEVKADRGNYKMLASLKAPQSQEEMNEKITFNSPYFKMLSPLTHSERDRMWTYLEANATMDSLYVPNLPLLHLASGTACLDTDAVGTGQFQYRVSLYRPDGSLVHQQESNVVKLPPSPDLIKPVLRQVRESSHQIMLEWYVTEQRQLSSYEVFRRVFGHGEYQRAPVIKGFNTNQDSIFLVVTDTAITSPAYYEYYTVPMDAFGNAGPPSDPVGAGSLGRSIPVVERLQAVSTGKDHEIALNWKFETRKYLRSVEIYRSHYYDSGFVKVAELPASDSSYVDHIPQGSENYYYYIVLNGPLQRSHPSAIVSVLYQDDTAPEPPTEIAAEGIDNGVRIHWAYQEPFVKGFFVYRSGFPDREFTLISSLIPRDGLLLSYTDTSKTLLGDQAYYYAVEAVSDSDVSSKLSAAVNGTPQMKLSIPPPQNMDVQWMDNSVMVSWDDLRELEPDLLGYILLRREEGREFASVFESLDGSGKNYFRDINVEPGKTYEYAVRSQKFGGQPGAMSDVVTLAIPQVSPVAPSQINLSATSEGIHIAWGQVSLTDLIGYRLYRQVPGQNPELVTALDKEQLDYLDKAVEKGKLYSYFMTSVNKKNVEGDHGGLVTIRY